MRILGKISELPSSTTRDETTRGAFGSIELIDKSPFSHFSLTMLYLLELQRRLQLLSSELQTIKDFMSRVVEKYRNGVIDRKKASYLASWASMQKEILLSVKQSLHGSMNEVMASLSAQDRYFLIFELKDVLKQLQQQVTLSKTVKKRLKSYESIIKSEAWKKTINDLPFEELIVSSQHQPGKGAVQAHRFNGLIAASSQEPWSKTASKLRSMALPMVNATQKTEDLSRSSQQISWEERMAEELMSTFIKDVSRDSSVDELEMDAFQEEMARLRVTPEIVGKDLEREIHSILKDIKREKQSRGDHAPPSTNASNESPELGGVGSSHDEEQASIQVSSVADSEEGVESDDAGDDEVFFGAGSLIGEASDDDFSIDREAIFEMLDDIKRVHHGKSVEIVFPRGLRARGTIVSFLWWDGSFHVVTQLEDVIEEMMLLRIVSHERNQDNLPLQDGVNLENLARELISSQLEVPKRSAFEEDILWQYSIEKYLGLLPWEVRMSRFVIFPQSLITTSRTVQLREEDLVYQRIMRNGSLKSKTGGFLGYLLGLEVRIPSDDANGDDAISAVHVLKARNDVREVLSMLRGGLTVSDAYMAQFYQRVSKIWSVSLEEAKLPVNQARYLLYFFYSGNRKGLRSCERWLRTRFDITSQHVVGMRRDSTSPRTLIIL